MHDEQDRDAFAECCDEHNLEISVTIPDDPTIRHADHDGTAPYETDADGETVRAIRDPADELARSHGKRVAER